MANPAQVLTGFVLEKMTDEPPAKQAALYHALADLAAPCDRKTFEKLATDCERIDSAHTQLLLDFQRRARG